MKHFCAIWGGRFCVSVVLFYTLLSTACALLPPQKMQQLNQRADVVIVARVVKVRVCSVSAESRQHYGKMVVRVVHAVKSRSVMRRGECLTVKWRCHCDVKDGMVGMKSGELSVRPAVGELVLLYLRAVDTDGAYSLVARGASVVHLGCRDRGKTI